MVIGGFGRVGQLIAQALEAENVPYVGLDTDGEMIAAMREQGQSVYFGDAGRLELLEKIGGAQARAFVVTVNNPRAAERMVAAARQIKPQRAGLRARRRPAHAARLIALGAVGVIPETVEASLQLAGRLLDGLDLPDEPVRNAWSPCAPPKLGRLDSRDWESGRPGLIDRNGGRPGRCIDVDAASGGPAWHATD